MDETFDAQGAWGLDRQIVASGVSGFCLIMRAAKAALDQRGSDVIVSDTIGVIGRIKTA